MKVRNYGVGRRAGEASTSIYVATFIFVRLPWISRVAFDVAASLSIDFESRSCARV